MYMPRSVYFKMRLMNFNHDYIIGINDAVANYLGDFPNGLTEADWAGIADILHNNTSVDIDYLMTELVAAYGN